MIFETAFLAKFLVLNSTTVDYILKCLSLLKLGNVEVRLNDIMQTEVSSILVIIKLNILLSNALQAGYVRFIN